MQVERFISSLLEMDSGGRVSNVWVTYLKLGNNFEKSKLIPRKPTKSHDLVGKDLSV